VFTEKVLKEMSAFEAERFIGGVLFKIDSGAPYPKH